jgi:hypothetical protein
MHDFLSSTQRVKCCLFNTDTGSLERWTDKRPARRKTKDEEEAKSRKSLVRVSGRQLSRHAPAGHQGGRHLHVHPVDVDLKTKFEMRAPKMAMTRRRQKPLNGRGRTCRRACEDGPASFKI